MANQATAETTTWSDFAISLFDKLTGRGAEITYEFQDFQLDIPSKMGPQANYAHWKINGTLNIRTNEQNGASNE